MFHPPLPQSEEKPKTPSKVLFIRFLRLLKPYKYKLAIVFVFSFIAMLTNLIMPYITKVIVDKGILGRDINVLLSMTTIFLSLQVVNWISRSIQGYLSSWILNHLIFDLRRRMYHHLLKIKLDYFTKSTVGKIMSRITNDVNAIGNTMTTGLVDTIIGIIAVSGSLFMMFMLSIHLSLVTLITLVLLIYFSIVFAKKARKAFLTTRVKIAEVTSSLEKDIAGAREIQTYIYRKSKNIKEFSRVNLEYLKANLQATKVIASLVPTLNFTEALGYFILLAYGGYLVLNKVITLGTIIAFYGYFNNFFRPIINLALFYNSLQATFAAMERIFQFLDEECEKEEGKVRVKQFEGYIKFENVTFSYEKDHVVLKNLSFEIKPKEKIAIVGPTGSGKTTIINLLLRFYEPQEGRITIDGIDIRDIPLSDLRRNIALVTQEPILFTGTIMDNIKFGRNISDDEVIQVCKELGIHDFISKLPDGYNTIIQEGGKNLSVGQRQLICLARALVGNPSIIILDEAMSSVDPYTEVKIKDILVNKLKDKTCIIVAHRLLITKDVDRIIVLKNGKIIEEGSHEELMKKNGLYAKLYRAHVPLIVQKRLNSHCNTQIYHQP